MPDTRLEDIACLAPLPRGALQLCQSEAFVPLFVSDHSPAVRTGNVASESSRNFSNPNPRSRRRRAWRSAFLLGIFREAHVYIRGVIILASLKPMVSGCFQEITDQTGFDVPAMFIDAVEKAANRK